MCDKYVRVSEVKLCSVFMLGLGEICCDNVFDVRDYTIFD